MRILLLSYCFPPVPLIEAQVAAKVSGHLGAEVDVIAAEPNLWRLPPDHSLDDYVEEAFGSVTRLRSPAMPLLLRTHGRVPFLSERPDALTFLNGRVLGEVRRRPLGEYDLLVTRGQFHSIHMVPLRLDRRPPWVAHFSDPWVGNPTRGDARRVRWINVRKEARVVEAADRLVFTSATAAEYTVSRYPDAIRAKTRHVPHCFMPELFERDSPSAATGTDRRLLARHVGNLRWNRHPEPLFQALLELGRLRPGALAELRVDLLGLIGPSMLEGEAARALPAGLVEVSPPVDYRASLLAMRESDLLLVTETDAARSVDLHAKIVDYTGAGVPIVGIVPPGPTAELIAALGGWHGHPGQPREGAQALQAGLEEARRRRDRAQPGPWGDATVRARYSAETVGGELAGIYREALAAPPRRSFDATTT
jgi:glycosyltransferase involved in cell wall biosynthesis